MYPRKSTAACIARKGRARVGKLVKQIDSVFPRERGREKDAKAREAEKRREENRRRGERERERERGDEK